MATFVIVNDIPSDFVTKPQLTTWLTTIQPGPDLVDDATIEIVANQLAVKAIAQSKVTGLTAALAGKLDAATFWTNLLAADTAGFIKRVDANTVAILEPLTAITDLPQTNLPADNAISALTFTGTPTGAECEALRDLCEDLRDELAETQDAVNTLLARLRVTGGAGIIAD